MATVKEASQILGISTRAIQKRCKTENIPKKGRNYSISEETIKAWGKEDVNEPKRTLGEPTNEPKRTVNEPEENRASDQDEITESFSPDQYDKLQEVIHHYPELLKRIEDYQKEVNFLRDELKNRTRQLDEKSTQLDKLLEALNGSIKSLHQANYITAKDKNIE